MTRALTAGLALVAVAAGFFGASLVKSPPAAPFAVPVTAADDPDNQTLIQLQEQLAAALAPVDSIALDTLLAHDFLAINAADQLLNKTAVVPTLRGMPVRLLRVVDDSIQVRRYGFMALMTLRETLTFRDNGTEQSARLRITEVWFKRGGRWQVVAGQALIIP
jgi:hypothetical protein